jgi:hypothetical protein
MSTDYEKALLSLKDFPKYYLGQEVKTPLRKGIIIEQRMHANGICLTPVSSSSCIVWFSTESRKEGFVQKIFSYSEIETVS